MAAFTWHIVCLRLRLVVLTFYPYCFIIFWISSNCLFNILPEQSWSIEHSIITIVNTVTSRASGVLTYTCANVDLYKKIIADRNSLRVRQPWWKLRRPSTFRRWIWTIRKMMILLIRGMWLVNPILESTMIS